MCNRDQINPAHNPLAEAASKLDVSGSADTVQKAFQTGNWGEPLGSEASGWDVLGAGPLGMRGIGGSSDKASDRAVGRTVGSIFAGYGAGTAAGAGAGAGSGGAVAGETAGEGAGLGSGLSTGGAGAAEGMGGGSGLTTGGAGAAEGMGGGQGLVAPAGTNFAGGATGGAVGAGGAVGTGVGGDFGGFGGGGTSALPTPAGGAASAPGQVGQGLQLPQTGSSTAPGSTAGADPNLPPSPTTAASPSATTPPANAPASAPSSQPSAVGKAFDYMKITSPNGGLGPNAIPLAGLGYSQYSARQQRKSAEEKARKITEDQQAAARELLQKGLSGQVPAAIAAKYNDTFMQRVQEIQQRYANMGRDPKSDSAAQAEMAKAAMERDAAFAQYANGLISQGLSASGVAQGPQMESVMLGYQSDQDLQKALMTMLQTIAQQQAMTKAPQQQTAQPATATP